MKRMKKIFAVLLLATLLSPAAIAELIPVDYQLRGKRIGDFVSPSLYFTVDKIQIAKEPCFVTAICMEDPGKQIKKATSQWETNLLLPSDMAQQIEDPALVINGSGYVSPQFPWIPEDYPGTNSDYYYTPLGSLTITNGEIFRNLEGVSYYGLTLEEDGLHMYVNADNETVLAASPSQTWSFYTGCPLIENHESIVDTEWRFANAHAMRTIIAKKDAHNYVILTVTNQGSKRGLTLLQCIDWLKETVDPIWAYDLDGGPSSALLRHKQGEDHLRTVWGNKNKDADIMAFVELK
ncbi:MAG: phosphodiester glycosidase family protein [Clostridia bacterium]|nr:phosphodiester glycosidase family protein [Clostridia bacterium]